MLEFENENKPIEVDEKEKVDDENSKKSASSKSDVIKKFSELHISFLIAFVDCDYQKVNNILSKDPSLVDMKNPFDGNTALHFASKFGDIALIRALAGNYKADVNIINHSGKTPLHYATEFSKDEAVNYLVSSYGARKDIRDYNGKLPIDWVKTDHLEAMEKILGRVQYGSITKEEKAQPQRLSGVLKILGNKFTHEGSPKHIMSILKGTECCSASHRTLPNSQSTDTLSSKNFLSLSNADVDKPHLRKTLSPRSDKSFYKAGSEIRGSFSGKFN